jgi:hypothetical protein
MPLSGLYRYQVVGPPRGLASLVAYNAVVLPLLGFRIAGTPAEASLRLRAIQAYRRPGGLNLSSSTLDSWTTPTDLLLASLEGLAGPQRRPARIPVVIPLLAQGADGEVVGIGQGVAGAMQNAPREAESGQATWSCFIRLGGLRVTTWKAPSSFLARCPGSRRVRGHATRIARFLA